MWARCPQPARFDVLAHDPYSVGGPERRALNVDDVSIPDLGKLTRPLRVAERTGRVRPRGRKGLWVTEFGWDSNPPDPQGVPGERHARWLEQAFYVLWREGVDAVTWFKIVDEPSGGDYGATYQSGLYFLDGRPKPALTAFRFPFVAERTSGTRVRTWGKAPRNGAVRIQARLGSGWRTIKTIEAHGNRVFLATMRIRGAAVLRAVVGSETSLSWNQP